MADYQPPAEDNGTKADAVSRPERPTCWTTMKCNANGEKGGLPQL